MRMIKRMVLGFLLMGGFVYGNTEEVFKNANSDYEGGRFPEAAKSYQEILKTDGPRVSVLRNLGSSYFQMAENGRAILAFERALTLKPRDPDLLANLKLAQDQAAVYPLNEGSFWRTLLERNSARWWSMAALAAAILLPLSALAWFFGKARLWIAIFAAADLVVLGIAIAGLVAGSTKQDRGIIVAKTATVRISPFEKADDRGSIAEGREVSLGKETNGYFWITSKDGSQEGWVFKDEVAQVSPDPQWPVR